MLKRIVVPRRAAQIFQRSKWHLKIPCATRVSCGWTTYYVQQHKLFAPLIPRNMESWRFMSHWVSKICTQDIGLQSLYGKGRHTLLWACSRAASGQITVSGVPNLLNYCLIFIMCIQYANVAAGHGLETHDLRFFLKLPFPKPVLICWPFLYVTMSPSRLV